MFKFLVFACLVAFASARPHYIASPLISTYAAAPLAAPRAAPRAAPLAAPLTTLHAAPLTTLHAAPLTTLDGAPIAYSAYQAPYVYASSYNSGIVKPFAYRQYIY